MLLSSLSTMKPASQQFSFTTMRPRGRSPAWQRRRKATMSASVKWPIAHWICEPRQLPRRRGDRSERAHKSA